MTTDELLNYQTKWGQLGDCLTVYRGPCRSRQTLRECHKEKQLVFSVNRSHIGTPIGSSNIHGFYESIEEAVAKISSLTNEWRISAHCRGWSGTEECPIYFAYWKPAGELRCLQS